MDYMKARSLQYVRRFNYEPCIKYQSVAEHSFMCGLLMKSFLDDVFKTENNDLVVMAMMHDIAESVTGDIPHLVKSFMKSDVGTIENIAYYELGIDPIEDVTVVRFIDVLELCIYLQEERLLGNKSLLTIEAESRGRLKSFPAEWQDYAWKLLDKDVQPKDMPSFMKH